MESFEATLLIAPESDFTLSAAEECLKSGLNRRRITVVRVSEIQLQVSIGRFRLLLEFNDSPELAEICREMAASYPDASKRETVASCKCLLSIWCEDDDQHIVEKAESAVELLESRFPGLFVFDPFSGEWWTAFDPLAEYKCSFCDARLEKKSKRSVLRSRICAACQKSIRANLREMGHDKERRGPSARQILIVGGIFCTFIFLLWLISTVLDRIFP
ncbi:MAG: hypothetical protein L0Y72_20545 [Gemmataceae bacterium]|nr:hypothetical protein [Gemmataceae bacterium]MCI0741429.1 hypothetical protein [Gemmataceae bacterium]